MDLVELAERCEKATGRDRELDALIWCAINGKRYQRHNPAYASFGQKNPETQVEFTEPPKRTRLVTGPRGVPHAQPWTASLDAAIMLVPEGHTIQLSDWEDEQLRSKGAWQAIVLPRGARGNMTEFTFTNRCDHAATPALALTAAALRARAALSHDTR